MAPAKDSPLGINVLFSGPETISIFDANNSPFWNTEFSLLILEESYLTYYVILSLIESVESNIFIIVAATPEVKPTIFWFNSKFSALHSENINLIVLQLYQVSLPQWKTFDIY